MSKIYENRLFTVFTDCAGKVCLTFGEKEYVNVHLWVGKEYRVWGYEREDESSWGIGSFGLGPLLLVCW